MAIQSEVFSTAFNVRTFASTKYIATKQHMAIWLKRVSDETWTQLSVNEFELINNSAVLIDAPSSSIYSMIEIRVADEPNELGSSQSDITIVASLESQIQEIVDTVIPNINEILLADDNATIATTKASEASTSAGEALASKNLAVTSAGNALVSEQNADTSEANALSYKNSAEASATTATTQAVIATTKAGEASTSATNALASEVQAGAYASQLDPSKIVAKDSPTGASINPVGTTAQRPTMPTNGYIRYNTDLLAFEGYSNGAWTSLGGGATGGGTDHIFNLNGQTVNTNYTIPVGQNAVTAGDITINSGVTVTVSSGSKWSIV